MGDEPNKYLTKWKYNELFKIIQIESNISKSNSTDKIIGKISEFISISSRIEDYF